MTCDSIGELIGPYVDNDLSSETRRRVEIHLLGCAPCAWEAQSLSIVHRALREDVGVVVASDAFRTRTMGRLRSDNPHLAGFDTDLDHAAQFTLPLL
jgi:anti-sigma factor RsiW